MAENTNIKEGLAMTEGKYKILLFRRFEDRHKEKATRLVFQTDHTFEFNRAIDSFVTKDGRAIKPGELESAVSISAIQATGDPTAEMLMQSVIEGEKLELWEVNIDPKAKDENGEYPAIYARGYLDNWSIPSPAEGEATIDSNFVVDLKPQFGRTSLDAELEEAVQYAFHDVFEAKEEGEGEVTKPEETEDDFLI